MPLVSPIDIAVLSSPVPLPGESGTVSPGSFGVNTQQNFSAMTRGSGVTSPIGTGNQMTPMPTSTGRAQGQGDTGITGAALESGGANVGGVVQQAPKDDFTTKVEFATYADQQADMADKALQAQTDEYMAAYKEGDTSQQTQDGKSGKTDVERLGDVGVDIVKDIDQRISDSKVGKAYDDAKDLISDKVSETKIGKAVGSKIKAFKEEREKGMSGARRVKRADRRADRKARKSLSKSEKRAMRKAQRKQRRAAFKQFKEERDYEASLAAAQL